MFTISEAMQEAQDILLMRVKDRTATQVFHGVSSYAGGVRSAHRQTCRPGQARTGQTRSSPAAGASERLHELTGPTHLQPAVHPAGRLGGGGGGSVGPPGSSLAGRPG